MDYYKKESENDWSKNTLLHTMRSSAAGGGYSTIEDLFRFSKALRAGKLLDQKHTAMLLNPASRLGFEHEPTPIDPVIGHSGGFPGIMCKFEIHADKDVTAIILSNMDNAGIPVHQSLHEKTRTLN